MFSKSFEWHCPDFHSLVGVPQGCNGSPMLFNIFTDGILKF